MTTTVLFIHSAGPQDKQQGSTQLIAYLKERLKADYRIIAPEMPDPENLKYADWKKTLGEALNERDGEVILVGHSLGGSAVLKFFSEEERKVSIKGMFLISSPYWGLDEEWQLKDFILKNDFERNLADIPQLYFYHSIQEEIVPFSHHKAYAEKLPQATLRQLEGDRHLFYEGLPELVKDINNL